MRPIDGNTQGIKPQLLRRIEATFKRRVKGEALVQAELARYLVEISRELNRQVGVLIDRGGQIERVIVGQPARLYLPDLGRARGGFTRLRGLRLVRTELRGQGLTREDLADLTKLRLDAVVVLDVPNEGGVGQVHFAQLLVDAQARTTKPSTQTVRDVYQLPEDGLSLVREAESEMARVFAGEAREVKGESALLVGVWEYTRGVRKDADASMREMAELARTAGIQVVDSVVQIRRELDPRTLVGQGKIEELSLRALELGADLLIFDRDLQPSQLRAITNATELKVIDRTQLILGIFAKHARSRDGKVQVELAQLKYALPRLIEKSTAMSRLTGGIGGQGPGETKLEIHRRRARERIHRLEQEIERLSVQRGVRRARRRHEGVPVVSIVGYTNAGKSTLLNALTKSNVLAEDKLFATLDPTTRRLRFPEEREIILTDTVGFIRDLPKDLVNAFKATLEELEESDLILLVIDASDPLVDGKRKAVESLLTELGLEDIERLVVVNKIDETPRPLVAALKKVTGGVPVSAQKREGLEKLLQAIEDRVFRAVPIPRRQDDFDVPPLPA